jgi:pyruvate/2-oxoacid:ferredoxin oxidoreductase beta subunit
MNDTHGTTHGAVAPLTRKDFVTDQEVRWCPGCGDYAILAQTQRVMPHLGVPRENLVLSAPAAFRTTCIPMASTPFTAVLRRLPPV